MESGIHQFPVRRAAVNGLAVVGFLALIFAGITLAVYAARFVPTAVSELGAAGVYFSSIFSPGDEANELEVVPTDLTTIPFEPAPNTSAQGATGTTTEADSDVSSTPATPAKPVTPAATTPGPKTTATYPVDGTTPAPATLSGLPDLMVVITERGYLTTSNPDSYVKADEVPDGKRGAVKFTVTNIGTNVTGAWKFKAEVPTSPSYTFTSPNQQTLNPGERIEYVLGFDRTRSGDSRRVTITIDSAKNVTESNENNNEDSETLVIN